MQNTVPLFIGEDAPLSFTSWLAMQAQGKPKGERTRARIQVAACDLLQNRTPQEVTIPELCKEAGIAHGTFYLYFTDRVELLAGVLMAFVGFLQDSMQKANAHQPEDTIRASTTAYLALAEQNAGLMKCLLHHHDSFPEARAAFHKLNSDWINRVVASIQSQLKREGRAAEITQAELLRRAHALGGMVDQYVSGLFLSEDPSLVAVSGDRAAVIDTLCLIWKRGMTV